MCPQEAKSHRETTRVNNIERDRSVVLREMTVKSIQEFKGDSDFFRIEVLGNDLGLSLIHI